MEKEKEIEVDPAIEATARNRIRYVTSFGMVNVRKERTVPTNMSRIPQDLGPRKRRVRAKAVVEVLPHQENQRKRWLRSLAHTSNRANVVVVTNVFTNMKMQLSHQVERALASARCRSATGSTSVGSGLSDPSKSVWPCLKLCAVEPFSSRHRLMEF